MSTCCQAQKVSPNEIRGRSTQRGYQHPYWAIHKRTRGFTGKALFSLLSSALSLACTQSTLVRTHTRLPEWQFIIQAGNLVYILLKWQPRVIKDVSPTNRLIAAKYSKRSAEKVSNPTCNSQACRILEIDSKLKHVKPKGLPLILTHLLERLQA